jgi:hypothetical protein
MTPLRGADTTSREVAGQPESRDASFSSGLYRDGEIVSVDTLPGPDQPRQTPPLQAYGRGSTLRRRSPSRAQDGSPECQINDNIEGT